jgi:hypothetical protein
MTSASHQWRRRIQVSRLLALLLLQACDRVVIVTINQIRTTGALLSINIRAHK